MTSELMRVKYPAKVIGIAYTDQGIPSGFLDLAIPVLKRLANWRAGEQWRNYGWHSGMCRGKDGADTVICFDNLRAVKSLWRFTGYADDLVRNIRHSGWYSTSQADSGEVLRGCVVQLPAKNGVLRYLAGYEDSVNDQIVVYCDQVFDEENDAARMSDEHARVWAEVCKEFDEQESARLAEEFESEATDGE